MKRKLGLGNGTGPGKIPSRTVEDYHFANEIKGLLAAAFARILACCSLSSATDGCCFHLKAHHQSRDSVKQQVDISKSQQCLIANFSFWPLVLDLLAM